MIGITRYPRRTASALMLGVFGMFVGLGTASALPPSPNSSGLSPAQCYRKDSDCTQMCGQASAGMRDECFGICDRMLNRCLDTGDWTDSAAQTNPGGGGRKPAGVGRPLNEAPLLAQ